MNRLVILLRSGISILFHLLITPSLAQGPPLLPQLKTYPPSSYDGHPQVYCAAYDPFGGVWFGTNHFAIHHDGEEWQKIPTRKGMSILTIDIDDGGRIWVGGTSEFGYLRVVPHSDKNEQENGSAPSGSLEYISLIDRIPDSISDPDIIWKTHALEDRVVFNAQKLLYVYQNGRIRSISPQARFFLSYEVNGKLWVQDRKKGLFVLRKREKGRHEKAPLEDLKKLPGSGSIADKKILDVIDEAPGLLRKGKREFLILTFQNGIYRYTLSKNGKKGTITPIAQAWHSFFRKARLYQGTALDPKKNPWHSPIALSTNKKGMVLLDTLGRPVQILDQEKGMGANKIWRTIHGAPGSGILWSTTNKGITKWTLEDPRTFAREGEAFKGRGSDVSSYQGRIFIATDQGIRYRKRGTKPWEYGWGSIQGENGPRQDLLLWEGEEKSDRELLSSGPDIIRMKPYGQENKELGTK